MMTPKSLLRLLMLGASIAAAQSEQAGQSPRS